MSRQLNASNAMLVELNIRVWTARKYDRRVSEEIAQSYNADPSAGRYNKVLIALEQIKEIVSIATEARTFHYNRTLPWTSKGPAILPAAMFPEYSEFMRACRQRFEPAVDQFEGAYPQLIDDAKVRLNGLWNADDYPSPRLIARKFGFEWTILPLPDRDHFLIDLGHEETERIKRELEQNIKRAEAAAMQDLYTRLYNVVSHCAERLADVDGRLFESVIGNISELIGLLPRLNITGDAILEGLQKEAESKLAGLVVSDLKKNQTARIDAAREAQSLADRINRERKRTEQEQAAAADEVNGLLAKLGL